MMSIESIIAKTNYNKSFIVDSVKHIKNVKEIASMFELTIPESYFLLKSVLRSKMDIKLCQTCSHCNRKKEELICKISGICCNDLLQCPIYKSQYRKITDFK